ncbi:MAG TPA: hypothetical protein PLJ21_00700 [Pseudobdellovibrionaceae bacterium]|nr:hypothetical protein [Pseudobdellovibrionaceae bacterium]
MGILKGIAIHSILILFYIPAYSSDPPPAPAHGEADGAEKVEIVEKKRGDTWSDVSSRVQGLKAKIKSKQEILNKLLTEKSKLTDEAKKNEMVREAIKEHKELQGLIKDYDRERTYLQFSFPERGQKNQGQYKRIESKNFEEFDQELSMQSKLDQSMRILKKQYQIDKKNEASESKEENNSEKDKRYELFEPKIIQK